MDSQKRLIQIPTKYKKLYLRAIKGRSQAAAIRASCLECTAWVSDEVDKCTDTGCSLYQYRITGRKIPK